MCSSTLLLVWFSEPQVDVGIQEDKAIQIFSKITGSKLVLYPVWLALGKKSTEQSRL